MCRAPSRTVSATTGAPDEYPMPFHGQTVVSEYNSLSSANTFQRKNIYDHGGVRRAMCLSCGIIISADPRSGRVRILDMGCMA